MANSVISLFCGMGIAYKHFKFISFHYDLKDIPCEQISDTFCVTDFVCSSV